MPYDILSKKEVEIVHEESLKILEGLGLEVLSPSAKELYLQCGCRLDEETGRLQIPRGAVEEYLQYMPSTFTLHARDEAYDKTLPDDGPIFCTIGAAPYMNDPVTGEMRLSTSEDIAHIARLVNELDGIDAYSAGVLASDSPGDHYWTCRFYITLKHCKKISRVGSLRNINEANEVIKICSEIAGSEKAFLNRPFLNIHATPIISPLRVDSETGETFLYLINKGVPVFFTPLVNGGLTAPLSLEGCVIQTNAEFLAIAVLAQMAKKGTKVMYGSFPVVSDMRNMAYACGGVESAVIVLGNLQMARYYKVPSSGYAGVTNSKINDAQAGYEYGLGVGAIAGLGGSDFVCCAGMLNADLIGDLATHVINSEVNLMAKKLSQGYNFDSQRVASSMANLIECTPEVNFIMSDFTAENARTTGFVTQVSDRSFDQQWVDAGSRSAHDRALKIAIKILSQENNSAISQEVDKRIRAILPNLPAGDGTFLPEWQELL
jgi:trimethylamine--corrinoid protein Co-methyltransferase